MSNLPKRRPMRKKLVVLLLSLTLLVGVAWLAGWTALMTNGLAARALDERRYEDAACWVEWSRWTDPEDAEAEFLLARIHRKQGRLEALARHLRRAAKLGISEERIRREELLARAQVGDLSEIEPELLQMLVDQQGDGAEVAEAYANGLTILGRISEAEDVFDAWAQSFPDDPRPHFMRGRLREHRRAYAEAEHEYRAALARDANYYPAAYSLGRIHLSRNRAKEALPYFRRCESMRHNGLAKTGAARALKALGEIEQARTLLTEAVQEPPEDTAEAARYLGESRDRFLAAYELGTLETAAGRYDNARRWLEKAVQFNDRDLDARYALAVALRGTGDQDAAQREFEHVQRTRDLLASTDLLIDSLDQDPANVDARHQIGTTYLEYGSEETGLWWLRSVFQCDPDHAPTHQALAEYYDARSADAPAFRRLAEQHRTRAADDSDSPPSG